ncbi:polysaccharide biosynthesis tyrosine autokinase [Trinickia violacea]|uniref:non-specific protein-tyrosine kinase n=1 Tax=Trinickia violacea TaxID=2571746 RepID=A0A4V1EIK8_9BURK|nr:polysaccharide biosynthesis tyrosine autokinase [Trinickia violacea]QCP54120.1 polysaccharide biosynthesis tyrosine autokinase [Trinickia violacea]
MATGYFPVNSQKNRVDVAESDSMGLSPIDLLENLVAYRSVFLWVFGVILLCTTAYVFIATPIYSVDATIQVEEKKGSALGSLSSVAKALDIENSPVLGEIEIVRSRSVLSEAIEATGAQTTVSVINTFPLIGRWLGTILPRRENGLVDAPFGIDSWAWGGEIVLVKTFDVPYRMQGKRLELDYTGNEHWVLKDKDGDELLKGVVGQLAVGNGYRAQFDKILARPGTRFRLVRHSMQDRIERILKELTAVETKRQSSVIKLTYEDDNPIYASRLLNAIADAYLAQNVKRRSEESERSLEFLEQQLPVVKDRLQSAEAALNAFRNRQGSIDIGGEIKLLLDESATIEKSKLEAQMNKSQLATKYRADNPLLRAADAQLGEIEQSSSRLNSQIRELPLTQQQYLRLARDVEVNNQLYVGLLNNAQQLQIAKAGTIGNASIVDYAIVSDKPVSPNKVLMVAVGGILGLIFGFAAAQAVAVVSARVRDPKRLEAVTGSQTLGILPISQEQLAKGEGESPFLISKQMSDVPLVQSMRSLVLALQFALAEKKDGKVILVTSAVPGQGKSLTSANIAYLLAEKGMKTLLLDADLRKSTVHRYVDVGNGAGVVGVLQGAADLKSSVKTLFKNMDVLPVGKRTNKAAELFGNGALEELIRIARQEYDVVVIDSPPVLPVPDAALLSKHADATALVVRQNKVSYPEVVESLSNLAKIGCNVDGLVFNGFSPSTMRYGYLYRYQYYGGAYRYGAVDR